MKKQNKIMKALFAVLATFGMVSSVLADDATAPSITIKASKKTETYNLYKIFDLTYSGSKVSYTMDEDWIPFFNTTEGKKYITTTKGVCSDTTKTTQSACKEASGTWTAYNPITVNITKGVCSDTTKTTQSACEEASGTWTAPVYVKKGTTGATTETRYINITEDNIETFAKEALAYSKTTGLTPDFSETGTGADLTISVSEKGLGYYLVYNGGTELIEDIENTNKALVSLTSTTSSAEVEIKASFPTIDKVINVDAGLSEKDVEVGEVVPFKITGKVPDTTGYQTYTYIITDTMTSGLKFNEDVIVKINGTKLTAGDDTYKYKKVGNGFTVEIKVANYQTLIGKDIVVTYTGTVLEAAIDAKNVNTAKLTYSVNPKTTNTKDTTEIKNYVYTTKVQLFKYEINENNEKVAVKGAIFVLKNSAGKYFTYDETAKKVIWAETETDATHFESDGSGLILFKGLEGSETGTTYTLTEVASPVGYNLLPNDVVITLKRDGSYTDSETTGVKINVSTNSDYATAHALKDEGITINTVDIQNLTGTVLPTTGGMGTKLFILIGSILTLVSAIILVTNKKVSKEM